MMKEAGVGNIFTDTDGDFKLIIPNFMAAGVDGFLPMDVNAGMDIVAVRKQFPTLKFIGGFNKLRIAEGKEAIDAEFERILPVVRQETGQRAAQGVKAPQRCRQRLQAYRPP